MAGLGKGALARPNGLNPRQPHPLHPVAVLTGKLGEATTHRKKGRKWSPAAVSFISSIFLFPSAGVVFAWAPTATIES